MSDDDRQALEKDVVEKLQTFKGLPEENTQKMLAEYITCMVVTKRKASDIDADINQFFDEHARAFADWFWPHIRKKFGQSRRIS